MMRKKIKLSWRKDCVAASGVVVAMLVLIIFVSTVSISLKTFVPMLEKDSEADHMKTVERQYLEMKRKIDELALRGVVGSSYVCGVLIGKTGGPLFKVGRTAGTLEFDPTRETWSVFRTEDRSEFYARCRGNITFTSNNRYYVDQKFIYENGGVIEWQSGGGVILTGPQWTSKRLENNSLYLSLLLITIQGEKLIRVGEYELRLRITLTAYDEVTYNSGDWLNGKNVTVEFTTNYPTTWNEYINKSVVSSLLPSDYNITQTSNMINATFYNVTALKLRMAILEIREGTKV